jgi:molybdopterin-guanine dinucleotide biosynthesis protein A
MRSNNQYFIFSGEYYKNTDAENATATQIISQGLKAAGIPFKEAVGAYKGVKEFSFVVPARFESQVLEIARAFNQESVLFIDSMSNASLQYLDGDKIERIGRFTQVNSPQGLEAWSMIDGRFYTCK